MQLKRNPSCRLVTPPLRLGIGQASTFESHSPIQPCQSNKRLLSLDFHNNVSRWVNIVPFMDSKSHSLIWTPGLANIRPSGCAFSPLPHSDADITIYRQVVSHPFATDDHLYHTAPLHPSYDPKVPTNVFLPFRLTNPSGISSNITLEETFPSSDFRMASFVPHQTWAIPSVRWPLVSNDHGP